MPLAASKLAIALLLVAAPTRREAERLFNAGTAAYQAGHYDEALADFAASYEALPLAQVLFDIAQCDRKLGRWQEAALHYQRYLTAAPRAPNRAEVRDDLAQVRAAQAKVEAAAKPSAPPAAVTVEARRLDLPPPAPAPEAPTAAPIAAVEAPPPAHASRGPYWLGGAGLLVALAGGSCLIAGEVMLGGDETTSSDGYVYHSLRAPQLGPINGLLLASKVLLSVGGAALLGAGAWAIAAHPGSSTP